MRDNLELALFLVLTAAFLHAAWNALLKHNGERTIVLGLICFGHGIIGLFLVPFVAIPTAISWLFILASTFVHFFYYAFLLLSYRLGDLSQVYPIARGLAPILVAVSAYFLIGEDLPTGGWIGVFLVSFGIFILAWRRGGKWADMKAVGAALLTGSMIAAYSVIDGLGVRSSESPIGYIGWLFILEVMAGFYIFFRNRERLYLLPRRTYTLGLTGGFLSGGAYGLVIYAKTLAPLGAISAVRESSVIIAALIGVVLLGERPWRQRVLAAAIVAAGIILLGVSIERATQP